MSNNNNSTYNIKIDGDGKIANERFKEFSKPSVFSQKKYDKEDKKRMSFLNKRKHSKVSKGKKQATKYTSNNLNSNGISGDNIIARQQQLVREKELKQEQKLKEEIGNDNIIVEEEQKINNNKTNKKLTDFL